MSAGLPYALCRARPFALEFELVKQQDNSRSHPPTTLCSVGTWKKWRLNGSIRALWTGRICSSSTFKRHCYGGNTPCRVSFHSIWVALPASQNVHPSFPASHSLPNRRMCPLRRLQMLGVA